MAGALSLVCMHIHVTYFSHRVQITLKRVEVRGIADPVLCGEVFPEDRRLSICTSGWTLAPGPPECLWSVAYPVRDPMPMSDGLRALMEVRRSLTPTSTQTELQAARPFAH